MKARLIFIFRYFLFWMAFFLFSKLVFLFFNPSFSFKYLAAWPGIFYNGFKLDVSFAGYIMLLPCLLMALASVVKGKWYFKTIDIYSYTVLAMLSVLIAIDLPLYKEWGFRLDTTPLMYLKDPKEAFASTPFWETLLYTILAVAVFLVSKFTYGKLLLQSRKKLDFRRTITGIPAFILITGLLIIPIRGGFDTAPINTGSVYFHEVPFVNHAALNLPWNVMYAFTKLKEKQNPFREESTTAEDEIIFANYSETGKSKLSILNNSSPDILLIIVESLTAKGSSVLSNGEYNYTPHIDSLAKKGILFSNVYASGERSDRGLSAILSGFPALPTTALLMYPQKTEKLPGLPKTLKTHGYKSSFYYGGDIDFANMRAYLTNIGFEKFISNKDFNASLITSKWGVPDGVLFDRLYEDIAGTTDSVPIFRTVFTLSSHPPFDVPGYDTVNSIDKEVLFLNSLSYTDSEIGRFIHKLESNNLLDNTLVIIVADHGYTQPGNSSYSSKEKFSIPLILYGGAVDTSCVIQDISSQCDLPAVLFDQLGIDASDYVFSRNILGDDFREGAYYAYRNGFGYINDSIYYNYYLNTNKSQVYYPEETLAIDRKGRMFYHALYEYFLNL